MLWQAQTNNLIALLICLTRWQYDITKMKVKKRFYQWQHIKMLKLNQKWVICRSRETHTKLEGCNFICDCTILIHSNRLPSSGQFMGFAFIPCLKEEKKEKKLKFRSILLLIRRGKKVYEYNAQEIVHGNVCEVKKSQEMIYKFELTLSPFLFVLLCTIASKIWQWKKRREILIDIEGLVVVVPSQWAQHGVWNSQRQSNERWYVCFSDFRFALQFSSFSRDSGCQPHSHHRHHLPPEASDHNNNNQKSEGTSREKAEPSRSQNN